jgi:hypothetical protein
MRKSDSENQWSLHRKIGIVLYPILFGCLIYGASDNVGGGIIALVVTFLLFGIFSDPNAWKSDIELRSTTSATPPWKLKPRAPAPVTSLSPRRTRITPPPSASQKSPMAGATENRFY